MGAREPKKILICHPKESIRESLKLILWDLYDLILTGSIEQCLQCLDNDKTVGLLLLDINALEINGREALKAVKESHPELNVIIVSESRPAGNAAAALLPEAAGHIAKPFKSDVVLEIIRKFI